MYVRVFIICAFAYAYTYTCTIYDKNVLNAHPKADG